jgi:hypothetical protein
MGAVKLPSKVKRPKSDGRRIHCGAVLATATRDHVFPHSWYPDSTPPNIQRWTAPSCAKCNHKFGAMEEMLFVRFAMCVDPRKQAASGVWNKARRALGIGVNDLSESEKRIRKALRDEILGKVKAYDRDAEPHVIPGFGPHAGFPMAPQIQVEIPGAAVHEVAKKILRGCESWLGKGRIIDPPYELEVYMVTEAPVAILRHLRSGPDYLGPGCRIRRAVPVDDPMSAVYEILIWDSWKLFFSILPSENA